MKRMMTAIMGLAFATALNAQGRQVFKGHLYNDEYQVYLDIDFYQKNILVPNQEIFGQLPGYFGAKRDMRKWLITDIKLLNDSTARVDIINDYGSEDLSATLYKDKNGNYILKQGEGSTIKIVVDRKWVKIPKTLVLHKK
ncbi:hypothetical protein [Segatella baroniae]|uniref:hypothetical protein n=1 Tax=Segatella baroniae TaxID=305719 RepID=UPI000472506B